MGAFSSFSTVSIFFSIIRPSYIPSSSQNFWASQRTRRFLKWSFCEFLNGNRSGPKRLSDSFIECDLIILLRMRPVSKYWNISRRTRDSEGLNRFWGHSRGSCEIPRHVDPLCYAPVHSSAFSNDVVSTCFAKVNVSQNVCHVPAGDVSPNGVLAS